MPLPVVKEGVCDVINHKINSDPENNFAADVIEKMREENPFVAKMLDIIVERSKDPGFALYAAAVVYGLLANQQAADDLEKELGY